MLTLTPVVPAASFAPTDEIAIDCSRDVADTPPVPVECGPADELQYI
ncbi:hypothetical protein SBC1_31510 [Caballeronia sp. SBC1]|nr:hypothetical protein [Caballeronia sp. SBC1]QIN63127.1 hypothetical protein SBC1_31510 [Caballeronia sp. SBC1]